MNWVVWNAGLTCGVIGLGGSIAAGIWFLFRLVTHRAVSWFWVPAILVLFVASVLVGVGSQIAKLSTGVGGSDSRG